MTPKFIVSKRHPKVRHIELGEGTFRHLCTASLIGPHWACIRTSDTSLPLCRACLRSLDRLNAMVETQKDPA